MNDHQRRERLKQIVDESLALPPGGRRRAFLEQACAGDAALLDEALATLAALESAEAHGFLPTDAGNETAALDAAFTSDAPAAASERPGQRIGRYKLLQQIGEGGMGTVWMAEQTTPVVRRVALKVIKLGMDSRAVVARFEAERQALALMDHPHIARVLDAGTTDNGRPYFAMDLVRGQPATEYADLHGLTIPQRLDLFRQVCSAVQHAHQKGVIHRDLKPANVLVSTEDDRPFAKVIDFGIAKAVGRRLTDLTLFTQHGGMVGTLEYMSPEQADASPDVDTRSDVYSLGVMLYELLTGVTPLGRDRLGKAAFDELRRIIREEEPPRPSTRVTTAAAAGSLADVAKHRRTEPRRLGVLMRGELDWVVMRALEKERGRRYESAGALAEDLRRHAAGEPVEAAPPGAVYRLRKLARRHKGKFAAAAAVVLALLIGLAATAAYASKAKREAKRADAEATAAVAQRDLARSAATRASAAETSALAAKEATDHQSYVAAIRGAATAARAGDTDAALRQLDAAPQRYRGWEWDWLRNTTDQSVSKFTLSQASAATLSRDGRRVAQQQWGNGGTVLVDAATGEELAALPFHDPKGNGFVYFSDDSSRLAVGGDDGKLSVLNARDGSTISIAAGFGKWVDDVLFSADMTRIAIFASNASIRVHDVATGAELWRREAADDGDESYFSCFSISPDGRSVAIGLVSGEVTVWDVASGGAIWSIPAPSEPPADSNPVGVTNVEFSPDGIHVVTAENQFDLKVRSAATGELVFTLTADVGRFSFSGNGRYLLVKGNTFKLVDLVERRTVLEMPAAPYFTVAAMNEQGDRLLLVNTGGDAGRVVQLWDVRAGRKLAGFHGLSVMVADLAFCKGTNLVRAESFDGQIMTWDATLGEPEAYQPVVIDNAEGLACVAVSDDGERLAIGTTDGLIYLYDTRDWRRIITLLADSGDYIHEVAFDATGEQLAVRFGGWVRVRRLGAGHDRLLMYGESEDAEQVSSMTIRKTDNTLFIGSDHGKIHSLSLVDAEAQAQRFAEYEGPLDKLYASASGGRLAVTAYDKPEAMLDGRTGALIASDETTRPAADAGAAGDEADGQFYPDVRARAQARLKLPAWTQLRLGPDPRRVFSLASTGNGFRVWDLTPGGSADPILRVDGGSEEVEDLVLLPDGHRAVAIRRGSWDAPRGESGFTVWDNASAAQKLARRREGLAARREAEPLVQRLISGSGDRSARGTFPMLAAVRADRSLAPLVRTQAVNLLLSEADRRQREELAIAGAIAAVHSLAR